MNLEEFKVEFSFISNGLSLPESVLNKVRPKSRCTVCWVASAVVVLNLALLKIYP
jgi:hypothetical protein